MFYRCFCVAAFMQGPVIHPAGVWGLLASPRRGLQEIQELPGLASSALGGGWWFLGVGGSWGAPAPSPVKTRQGFAAYRHPGTLRAPPARGGSVPAWLRLQCSHAVPDNRSVRLCVQEIIWRHQIGAWEEIAALGWAAFI